MLVELNPLLVKVLGEVIEWATAGRVVHVRALSIASSLGQNGVKTRENSKKSTPTDSSNGQICQRNEQ